MHVDIYLLRRHGQMQYGKGKAVLHEVCAIAFFKSCREFLAAQHSSVDEKSFKASAGAADFRSSQKAVKHHAAFLILCVDRDNGAGCLPAVDPVDQLPQISVACSVEFVLSVHAIMKRDQGM